MPAELGGLRLDQALARMFPEHSRSRLQAWLRDGRLRVDAQVAKASARVWGGERVSIDAEQVASAGENGIAPQAYGGMAPEASDGSGGGTMSLPVAYEDEAVIVIDKPAGLVVHPGAGHAGGTLANALVHHAPQLASVPRAGIVHRLDKDTTGLMVVAKTLTAQTSLVRQLQSRSVERVYLALVHGHVAFDGEVDAPIGRDPQVRTRMAVLASGKEALTRYRVLKRYGAKTGVRSAEASSELSLLECRLATGRTHQIRVHLASIGHPLVGDPVYRRGRPRADTPLAAFRRQALHATRLAFDHPVSGERVSFQSPLPADFAGLLAALAK